MHLKWYKNWKVSLVRMWSDSCEFSDWQGHYRVKCNSTTHLEGVFLHNVSKQYQLQQDEKQSYLPADSVEGGSRYVGEMENGKCRFMTIIAKLLRVWTIAQGSYQEQN